MIVGQKLLECMLEKHGNMKILPNTQRLGKLTFDSNQVRKSKTNPNVLVAKASDGKDYGVVRKDDGSYDFAGSSRNLSLKDRLSMAMINPGDAVLPALDILFTVGIIVLITSRVLVLYVRNLLFALNVSS